MSLVGGGAKNKGANGERDLAELLMSWASGIGIELDLLRNLEQVRSGGHDLIGCPGLSIECKRVETLAVGSWWAQADRQAKAVGARPLLCYRQNRKKWQFVTRTWVWPAATVELIVHMEQEQARLWFHGHLINEESKRIERG